MALRYCREHAGSRALFMRNFSAHVTHVTFIIPGQFLDTVSLIK